MVEVAPGIHIHVLPVRPEHADEPMRSWDELCNVGVFVPPIDEPACWLNVVCDRDDCPGSEDV